MKRASLAQCRGQIDRLDARLVRLLNARAKVVAKISEIKKTSGLRAHDPKREAAVLKRVRRQNSGPLDDAALLRLYALMLKEFRGFGKALMERR